MSSDGAELEGGGFPAPAEGGPLAANEHLGPDGKVVVEPVPWDELEVARVDGGALCPGCCSPYREHEVDTVNVSGIDGTPYLRIGCDGKRLKL